MNEFIDRLRADREPTRLASAMADAIHQHLDDLLSDDPGENDRETLLLLREAERYADALRRELRAVLSAPRPIKTAEAVTCGRCGAKPGEPYREPSGAKAPSPHKVQRRS